VSNQGFLGHIELVQCRKCNYSLKHTQNFWLFIFVGQAEQKSTLKSDKHLAEVCGL